MRSRHGPKAALLALVLVSCVPPESKNPLSDRALAKADPRLTGHFAAHMDDADAVLLLAPKTGASLDLVLVITEKDKGASVLSFDAFPSVIAGKTYLNLRNKDFKGPYAEHFEISAAYTFVRYQFAKDGSITLATMQGDPVKAAIDAGK